jgi:hypothetical protein
MLEDISFAKAVEGQLGGERNAVGQGGYSHAATRD